jgi:hypothetical protein
MDVTQPAALAATSHPDQLRRNRSVQVSCLACISQKLAALRGVAVSYSAPSISHSPSAHSAAAAAENARLVSDPQKIIVFKSKVGRPPKKKPKLGQLNPHFTESVMTKPIPRVQARAVSSPVSSKSALAVENATSNAIASALASRLPAEAALHSVSGLSNSIQLAQLQYIEVQQRLSNLMALSQLQHPVMPQLAASGHSVPFSGYDFASLCNLNQLMIQSLPQLSNVVIPRQEGRFLDHFSVSRSLGSLQENTQLSRDQELLIALATAQAPNSAHQAPNSAYLEQLWQMEQARLLLIAQLTSNQGFS